MDSELVCKTVKSDQAEALHLTAKVRLVWPYKSLVPSEMADDADGIVVFKF